MIIMTSIVLWNQPTLLSVNAFSLLAYYMAKLNIQIERANPQLKGAHQLNLLDIGNENAVSNRETYKK